VFPKAERLEVEIERVLESSFLNLAKKKSRVGVDFGLLGLLEMLKIYHLI